MRLGRETKGFNVDSKWPWFGSPAALQVPQGERKGGVPRPEGLRWVCIKQPGGAPEPGEPIAVTVNGSQPARCLEGKLPRP